jgi:hypothetical protein
MKKDIELYSNPKKVLKIAKKIYGDNVNIDYSTRNDKKYMILNPNNNKWVHFGAMGYSDYTKHKDKKRREAFLVRNHKWADAPLYSPSYMSFYILW